ncbi:MAG: FHA domain-containing protein [Planctomycetes bacterium]|nr:FHA domain-containing protein [Planctomycetota bacterium]
MALLIIEKAGQGKSVPLSFAVADDGNPTVIGRAGTNDIIIEDERASRVHCHIVLRDGAWRLEDQGSRNKILYQGNKIDQLELKDQETFQIGSTVFRFRTNEWLDRFQGQELNGFRLEQLAGGEAGVLRYHGRQLGMDRPVRIDLIPSRRSPLDPENPESARQLAKLQEAAAAARSLQHPSLAPVLRFQPPQGDAPGHLIIRSPGARTLKDALEAVLQAPVHARVRFLQLLAEALLYRGGIGALRSPIGLGHVGLKNDGMEPWLPPLELAAWFAQAAGAGRHHPEFIPYLPPEVIARSGASDAAMDLPFGSLAYNLGAIGYHLLARKPPMGSGSGETILKNHASLAPTPADLLEPAAPRPVTQLLEHLLAKNPDARPQSSGEILAVLQEAVKSAPPPSAAAAAAATEELEEPAAPEESEELEEPESAGAGSTPAWVWLPLWICLWILLFIGVRVGTRILLQKSRKN